MGGSFGGGDDDRWVPVNRNAVDVAKGAGAAARAAQRAQTVMIDPVHVHQVALAFDLSKLVAQLRAPTRNVRLELAAIAARHNTITITPGTFEVVVLDLSFQNNGAAETNYVWLEPTNSTNPIEANEVTLAAIARTTVYATPSFTIKSGDKSNATFPQVAGDKPPIYCCTTNSFDGNPSRLAKIFPRIPIGWRLCISDFTANSTMHVNMVLADAAPAS